ncbi:Nn.00g117450.m01.CDS01 [Neocucurbitaria sp. VM-36]
MSKEFREDPSFKPWGPLISPDYVNEAITKSDIIIASVVWALTLINIIIALYLIYGQTRGSRSPLKSVYVWMIWLELVTSFAMGLICFLHLLKYIRPSFAFYMAILFCWCIQVQLLLQIIINRIRVIVPDRRRSRWIMIGTAVFVTAINISVFNIWIPARLQINHKWHVINEYWDRIEKGLYLIVDAGLNWYFLKTVKDNLINNGLTKYNKLVRFNQQIVLVSLLMDVMIIAAMSIPNSFVYIQFHPLAYLVKLNIEMTMANLIKRIAISTSRRTGKVSIAQEFKSSSNMSTTGQKSAPLTRRSQRGSVHELASIVSYTADSKPGDRIVSFAPTGNQIKQTREIVVSNEPNPFYERRESESEIVGGYAAGKTQGVSVDEKKLGLGRPKSLESVTEGNESLRSAEVPKRNAEDSDDEAALVGQKFRVWGRRPS